MNRTHKDLRLPGCMDEFDGIEIDMVFFLACEVGGAKFIYSNTTSTQLQILDSNNRIFQNVFPWLHQRGIPFIYVSSYMQAQSVPYGVQKRFGEHWTWQLTQGKVARFWNVFGLEHQHVGKRHVLTDWVLGCRGSKRVDALTDGYEVRQYMYVEDAASALVAMWDNWSIVGIVTDLSTGQWHSLREVAPVVTDESPNKCTVVFSGKPATWSRRVEPDLSAPFHKRWQSRWSLRDGIRAMHRSIQ